MAIIHQATVTPSKRDLVKAWLDGQPWSADGEVDSLGSYRFDDPAGEVGVEAMLVRRGGLLLHVPLTYRATPLPGSEAYLVGTMQHSALGMRWVYDATGDPVAVHCFVRALQGEQAQADLELWDGDTLVERRESAVRVHPEAGRRGAVSTGVAVIDVDGMELRVARVIGTELNGAQRLVAEWADGQAAVAALS